MTIELDQWRARYLLEALRVCEAQWSNIAKASDDEDVQADYGNDLLKLGVLYDSLEQEAIKAFGVGIREFSRLPIAAMTPDALKAFDNQDGKVEKVFTECGNPAGSKSNSEISARRNATTSKYLQQEMVRTGNKTPVAAG